MMMNVDQITVKDLKSVERELAMVVRDAGEQGVMDPQALRMICHRLFGILIREAER